MARLHTIAALACATTLSLALGGCVGALVVGGVAAAGGAGYAAGQERGVNGMAGDLELKTHIQLALNRVDPQMQSGITTTVYGGRVLLTGRVASPEMKAEAAQIAGQNQGVRAVYDELVVAPPEAAANALWDDTKDAWITARVRSEMAFDAKVRSVNYVVDTENGSVYLIGSARDQNELDRSIQIARYVPGVKRVVSYIELRYGAAPAVAAMPTAPTYAPAPAAAPYYPAPGTARAPSPPSSSNAIEVQKL